MSANLTRYYALRDALKRLRAKEPKGNLARHLNTMAHLVSGIVGSKSGHLPAIASKARMDVPTQPASCAFVAGFLPGFCL